MFMSPPWGGSGYHTLAEYKLEHIYPDFDKIMDKATQFTGNLMLFLPRNTCIQDLIARLLPHKNKLIGSKRKSKLELSGNLSSSTQYPELSIEIEQVNVGQSCKAIVVYTGDLAKITPRETI